MEQNLPVAPAAPTRSPGKAIAASGGVAAVCLASFADVAYEVHHHAVNTLNTELLLDIHGQVAGALVSLSAFLAKAASPIVSLIAGLLIAVMFFASRKRLDAWMLAGVLLASTASGTVIKKLLHNPRPHLFPRIVAAHGFSFPSGHTTMAFALWGFLAVWVVSQNVRQAWRWLVALLFVAFAALVGFSRLVLGVHWPTDVLAGALLASFWIAIAFAARKWASAQFARR